MKNVNSQFAAKSQWRRVARRYWTYLLPALTIMFAFALPTAGQQLPDKPITPATQAAIIDTVCKLLNDFYVFPDVAKKMEKHIRQLYKDKHYQNITGFQQFIGTMNQDLASVCNDKHLVGYFVSDDELARLSDDSLGCYSGPNGQNDLRDNNYQFTELKILKGNVGYLKLNEFAEAAIAGPTAIAAMNFLANTDAIIIDLRENRGGEPSMIQLLTSYFLKEPTHLNDFYVRRGDSIVQYWTQALVSGPRLTETKLYILTSGFSFSAAEEFAYNLKNLKRATIVGETTAGGAHPVNFHLYRNLNFKIQVPYGRAINPITRTNWEGVGVEPDIKVPPIIAFEAAYQRAVQDLMNEEQDEAKKKALAWTADGLNAKVNPPALTEEQLRPYTGTFGPRTISLENGSLYYQRQGRPKLKIIPMGNDAFLIDGVDTLRFKFEKDASGGYNKLISLYDNGTSDSNPRQ